MTGAVFLYAYQLIGMYLYMQPDERSEIISNIPERKIMEGALSKWTNVMKGWQYR